MRIWHIFSRAIDNYGDIAIAIRLARQLASIPENHVTLFTEISDTLNELLPAREVESYKFLDIDGDLSMAVPAPYIINVFNTEIPKCYMSELSQKTKIFIYEYLSAESWVEDFHLKSSLNPNPLIEKVYFYPGFNEKTGGLLREKCIVKNLHRPSNINQTKRLQCSFFYYQHTNINEFLEQFVNIGYLCKSMIPSNIIDQKIANVLPSESSIFKFLSFEKYDNLLKSSDLNFVRGEDSLCRAIFSGKPFVWQVYVQENEAHVKKLESFIEMYFFDLEINLKAIVTSLFYEWNTGQLNEETLKSYLINYNDISQFYASRSNHFISSKSAVDNLITYC